MPKVKIYSTPTCVYCRMEKEWLKKNNIAYEDINVAADQRAAMEMIQKSGQMGTPVTEIDGTIIVGFDRERLKKMLKIKD